MAKTPSTLNPYQWAQYLEGTRGYKPESLKELLEMADKGKIFDRSNVPSEESLNIIENWIRQGRWNQRNQEYLIKKLYLRTGKKPLKELREKTWYKLSQGENETMKEIEREVKNHE